MSTPRHPSSRPLGSSAGQHPGVTGSGRPPLGAEPPGPDAAVFVISVAAELSGLHPQTLRTYERLGLITPGRTAGGGRRYSYRDIELLREIAELTAAGTGLEGVRRILELSEQVDVLRAHNEQLQAELVAMREALRQALAERPQDGGKLPAVRPPATRARSWSGAAPPADPPSSSGRP